ncbi:hypothetical protein PR202_gb16905 [Eleusine coracana subsp. coracana]|uniref:Protein FAR1-RELATED SEQUENCE n=1 Tax=Eleusine coracana subsp. coracana TaxID=191504 RepID=A0AAV5F1I6_ELECO|nr:hypothetical protein PR202_gb16905 [Eleusine coracana subsp. coracana]
MGGHEPRCILTDEDSSIAAALRIVYPRTEHRLCRWHILRKHREALNALYANYEGLKDDLDSAINHPLTVAEFESCWAAMLDKYSLHENVTLSSLYDLRRKWIPAFFKSVFCGRMTSTQRSESTNNMVKNDFADHMTSIHMFAKHMQRFIEKRKRAAGHETLQCQSRINSSSSWQFEVQMSRAYSRAVFLKIRGTMKRCGAYRVETDPTLGDHHYLVQHTSKSNRYSWSQHKFKVTANASNGSYMCECKTWEHTGTYAYIYTVIHSHLLEL